MLSFSTCWNNSRHHDGEEMIDEIVELGALDPESIVTPGIFVKTVVATRVP